MSQVATQGTGDKPGRARAGAESRLLDTFGLSAETMTIAERRAAVSGYEMRHRIEAMVAGVTAKKIKHVYTGDGAATAPGLMILPRIPAVSLFPLRHVRILLGYTAHEIAHQLETDFDLLVALVSDTTIANLRKQQIKEFWNAIEDYRIEKRVKHRYPGFHAFIDDTRDFSARRFCDDVDAERSDPAALANPYRIGSVALTWIGAGLNGYRTRAPREALDRIDQDLRAWLESWAPDMAKTETCQEAFDLAVVIVEELDRLRTSQSKAEEPEADADEGGQSSCGNGQGKDSGGGRKSQPTKEAPDDQAQNGGDDEASDDKASTSADQDAEETGDANADATDRNTDGPGDADAADDTPRSEGSEGSEGDEAHDGSGPSDGESADGQTEGDADGQEPGDADDADGGCDNGGSGDGAGDDADGCNPASDGKPGDGTSEDDPSGQQGPGGSATPRPNLKVREGDEQSEAETADLEIDKLSQAINSMKGPEARDPKVADGDQIASLKDHDDNGTETRRETVERGQSDYALIRRTVGAPAARSAGILRRMLQSKARRTWQGGKEDGDLDFGRLVPMTKGAPDVYRQKTERTAVNTALSLLLDNSGSMNGAPIRTCQETAVVLDMAIAGTGTNVEITGFTGCTSQPVLYRYRAFGQKSQQAAASLGNMDKVGLGGTPVSTPLLEAWRRLSQQKEPRRVMIVVSDGGADYDDVAAARAAHDFIVARGCTVIGIAIGGDAPMRAWCDNVESVHSIEDLPVALTNLVRGASK